MKPILEIKQLSAGYGDLKILSDVSVSLNEGSMTVLMGPNGAGKSTLLKSVFSLTNITDGTITFDGTDITNKPTHELLSRGVAFVSQGRVNFGTLTVEENLRMGLHMEKNREYVNAQVKKIYAQFPVLKEKRNAYAFTLSGGQQQMLAIGRALMSDPRLLLMDEPSLGLAPALVKEMFAHIAHIRDTFDTTILIVEHNLKSLMDVADYGYVLVQGRVVADAPCEELKHSPIMKDVFVGTFE